MSHRIRLSQPIFKADKKSWHPPSLTHQLQGLDIPQTLLFYHIYHQRETRTEANSGHGESFHLDRYIYKLVIYVRYDQCVNYSKLTKSSYVSSWPSAKLFVFHFFELIFVINQHNILYSGRKYNTQHFSCCRVPIQIQFWHTFYMWMFSSTNPQKHCFLKTRVQNTDTEAKCCNAHTYVHETILICHQQIAVREYLHQGFQYHRWFYFVLPLLKQFQKQTWRQWIPLPRSSFHIKALWIPTIHRQV